MKPIAPRRSPGADSLRAVVLAAALALPGLAVAQEYPDGQAAYAQRDWAAAEAMWRQEADAGSADAMLGLGNLYDFGLLGEADPERALELYQRAADLGLAEASFNVAVMLDSGIGVPQDTRAATAWYAFAALEGHARAAYNLGQLFSGGTGVPRNDGLAAFWLERAARAIPSARTALAELPPFGLQVDAPTMPVPLAMQVFSPPSGAQARMAWVDGASPADARYRVELIRMDAEGAARVAGGETPGSAIAVDLAMPEEGMAWRVAQIAGSAYAASPWQTETGGPLEAQPIGIVRFEFADGDRRAEGLAARMGGAMARFGAIVDYVPVGEEAAASGVTYGFAQDAALAADVSAFLPGAGENGSARQSDADPVPGEIRVTLAFGAAPAQ